VAASVATSTRSRSAAGSSSSAGSRLMSSAIVSDAHSRPSPTAALPCTSQPATATQVRSSAAHVEATCCDGGRQIGSRPAQRDRRRQHLPRWPSLTRLHQAHLTFRATASLEP
jgi:hypothetical protein